VVGHRLRRSTAGAGSTEGEGGGSASKVEGWPEATAVDPTVRHMAAHALMRPRLGVTIILKQLVYNSARCCGILKSLFM
jgi:hypothetical protein